MFYRLVIQNNPDGTLSGAAAYDTPTSDARPITDDDLKDYMPEVNAAALNQQAAFDSEIAALNATHADALSAKDSEIAALNDQNAKLTIDLEAANKTISDSKALYVSGNHEAIDAMIKDSEMTQLQKDIAVAQAEADAANAKLAELTNPSVAPL